MRVSNDSFLFFVCERSKCMSIKSSFLGVDNFETLYSNALHYYHPDGGTINLVSTEIKPGVEICTLCLACHS